MKAVPQRKLKAKMAMKDLSLADVASLSGVPYTACSQVLNGHLLHPDYLRRIKEAIQKAPNPQEAALA